MRLIFILLFIFGVSVASISQDDGRPSAKQIEVQKQQAIADAKKERDEIKKQLTQAKVNNDDPETVKRMEDNLASLDQMIAVLERANPSGNKIPKSLPPSRNTEPAYVSPFTPIKLNQPVKTPTPDQAKDKLLWYSGRRIDANTLITASGLIVRYDRQNNMVILQPPNSGPEPDTNYYGLVNTLSQIKPMKNDYAVRMENMLNSFFMFPEIESAYQEYDLFKNKYYGLAKNKIPVTLASPNTSLESMIKDFINFINHLPAVQMVLPPERPNDLCLCQDAAAKAGYHSSLNEWLGQFYSDEDKIMSMLMRIYERIETMRFRGQVIPSYAISMNDPTRYYELILRRMIDKVKGLSKKYEQGNVLLEDGLVYATEALLNKQTQLGFDGVRSPVIKNAINGLIDDISSIILSDIFERYIEDNKSLRWYSRVFDYGLYLAHELNKKLVYPQYEVNKNLFQKWMEGLKKFNRFKLTVELDFHFQVVSKEENDMAIMWAKGLLQNEGDLYVSLGRHDCHWELYLTEVNHQKRGTSEQEYRIKMKIMSGQKDYVKDKFPPFNYSGPATLQMAFPIFKIDFCGGQSTVMIDVMTYAPNDMKIHEHDNFAKLYTTDLLGPANKTILGARKTEINVNELISTSAAMMNIHSSQLPGSSGDPALDKLRMAYLSNKEKYDLQYSLSHTTHTGKTVIPLNLEPPGATRLFDPTFDMVDPNDEDRKNGAMLTKGIISLKLIHAPK
jgi:hypothetical protein